MLTTISVPQERWAASNGPLGASGTQTADDDDGRDEQNQEDAHSQNSDHDHLQVDLTVLSSEPAVAQANVFVGGCAQHTAAVLVAFLAVERLGCHVTTKEEKSQCHAFSQRQSRNYRGSCGRRRRTNRRNLLCTRKCKYRAG